MASKIAAQMYTVREFTKTASAFADTLQRIRAIGYPAVQLSAIGCMGGDSPEVDAADARRMLDEHGLKCIATHRTLPNLRSTPETEIEFHQTLGCDYVAIGGLTADYRDDGAEGFRRFLRDMTPAMEQLKAAGIAFGFHNHAHEFKRSGEGRATLYDILIDEGRADLLNLELDLYWVSHAGINPQRLIERCMGRLPVIHVKDKEVVDKDGPVMAPIGEGNLDWEHLIPACEQAGTRWYAVEQDVCRRDPFDCLKSSFDFLTSMGL